MKASELDKYGAAPTLADIPAADSGGGGAHGHGGQGGHGDGGHSHSTESVRTATHCGHEIVIRTCYEITIDGRPLEAHLSVNDDGSLHSHALPEYSFTSAVDVVKKIVEAFPDEFPCDDEGGGGQGPPGGKGGGPSAGGSGHSHGSGGSSSGGHGHSHGSGGSSSGGHGHGHDHGEGSSSGRQGHGHGRHSKKHP